MTETVIPFPRAFKPHTVEPAIYPLAEPETLFGSYGDLLPEFTPTSQLPRSTFGLRPTSAETLSNMMAKYGGEDRVKRAARLAAEERASLGDRKHICPSLDVSLSERISWLGQMAENLAKEARQYGHLPTSVKLSTLASVCETISAEILIPHTPEGA